MGTTRRESRGCLAVVGGGTMGADIAASFAATGWDIVIANPRDRMRETLVQRFTSALTRLGGTFDEDRLRVYDSVAELPWSEIDLLIEAAPENLDTKRALFAEMERLAKPETPLCSNSSALPISDIGAGLQTQHRMLGAHYFMPAHLVPGVEIVCSERTDPGVADGVAAIIESTGKVAIRVKRDIPGFLCNRIQHALAREAIDLVARGIATVEDIDRAVRYGFGFRYIAAGPLLQKDHSGIDVHAAVAATIYPDLCNDTTPSAYLTNLAASGAIGMKAGRGFYEWTAESIAEEKRR
ncbi:MAG: 3-hydroxyacyl-CoA dehydrogenase NAD-binding domain-containing protein [Vicinamibacterales bacterium]|nr:3-hydroxyacyl-CoA dehydrogenase NAD-binding domain-containing protein [Vicinamibacterales bacterium]